MYRKHTAVIIEDSAILSLTATDLQTVYPSHDDLKPSCPQKSCGQAACAPRQSRLLD